MLLLKHKSRILTTDKELNCISKIVDETFEELFDFTSVTHLRKQS
jgi:hypothetical protein